MRIREQRRGGDSGSGHAAREADRGMSPAETARTLVAGHLTAHVRVPWLDHGAPVNHISDPDGDLALFITDDHPLAANADTIVRHLTSHHGDILAQISELPGGPGQVAATGVDRYGIDITVNGNTRRVTFRRPVANQTQLAHQLRHLLNATP